MSAAEVWCMLAVVAAAAAAVLHALAPTALGTYTSRAAHALAAVSVGLLAAGMWVALP